MYGTRPDGTYGYIPEQGEGGYAPPVTKPVAPPPQGTSGFGYNYNPYTGSGYNKQVASGVSDTAGYIVSGSTKAQASLQAAYENMFLQRAGAARGAFQENERRLGGEEAASGLAPGLVRLGAFERQAGLQGAVGQAGAEAQGGYLSDLAQLQKGTGTELASLKQYETSLYFAKAQADQARKAAQKSGLFSSLATVAGGFLGGPLGAAAGSAFAGGVQADGHGQGGIF